MSSDFRYHIASLAAIFLALGIGILIGTAFVGAPVVNRQTQLIRHLEAGVGDLRRETTERQQTEQALRILLPGIVRGKLAGRRVLVVQTGAYADAASEAADALEMAGAAVERVALPADAWNRIDTSGSVAPSEQALGERARHLAPLLAGAANEDLQAYRADGQLTGDALLSGAARCIVLVGGADIPTASANGGGASDASSDTARRLARSRDAALAQAWMAQGIVVVGTEPFDVGVSFIRIYQGAGLSTIDCIDRAIGKIALPFALLGEKGNFGLKPTADRVLPASLEAEPSPSPAPPSSE